MQNKIFEPKQKVFIRTVTYHSVGEIASVDDRFVELRKASWVASSGRFSECIATGSIDEKEYVGDMLISLDAIVDVFPWNHDLTETSI